MSAAKRPVNIHERYHAHVYFDEETLQLARSICKQASDKFAVKQGRVHERAVGPHPKWSCQLSFDREKFDDLIPWLDQNRESLSIFVHGLSGDDLRDHTDYAYWLGESVPLKLSIFS
ncbi:MAG: DOPA 4,5-dioxygenase family protein [Pseudomonadota bacterium]